MGCKMLSGFSEGRPSVFSHHRQVGISSGEKRAEGVRVRSVLTTDMWETPFCHFRFWRAVILRPIFSPVSPGWSIWYGQFVRTGWSYPGGDKTWVGKYSTFHRLFPLREMWTLVFNFYSKEISINLCLFISPPQPPPSPLSKMMKDTKIIIDTFFRDATIQTISVCLIRMIFFSKRLFSRCVLETLFWGMHVHAWTIRGALVCT